MLLKEWLSPQQLIVYETENYFDVVGCDSGKVYRIHHGIQANIDQLDDHGRPICRWCLTPENTFVTGDVMLAQKIALETCERDVLQVANRFAVKGRGSGYGAGAANARSMPFTG